MKTEDELTREYAKELLGLMLENPTLRVIAWVDSEGITDEYAYWAGHLNKPCIQKIAYSGIIEQYFECQNNDYEDCSAYYGFDADHWDDDTLAKKAAEIPWEDVIAVNVSIT